MKGILFGVGVGPGDPELLTLKAVRIIKECDVIAVPAKDLQTCTAYNIVKQALPEIENKEVITVLMPMTKDREKLEESHKNGADLIRSYLEKGLKVAFLTLGDPTVYSTYIYIHKRILAEGFEAEIINGIPSFCAVAARLQEGLVENSEQLHIIPGSYSISDAINLPGTKVLMKAGKKFGEVKEQIRALGLRAAMIENCGMEQEKVYPTLDEIPEEAGYYSLIIVK
ncbi:precorrin-2 C(20)-methyltransferase [Anaerocolumna sedimenticola]|uniref:Precorrin-2 C(20)-methyltransferase n=1 Tax=Anaerocolumna sedimenticola TaxID=2696063 RepID=A0A6P1TLT4_9FIRM|nr:precorrin-2 C(20)-methyltransferase [Anaerocolumna sedimenticola]QHQ61247.1 precorrin-2 C(20)-methyltransferase [Anaerocolumna sedimenticola]